MNSSLIHPWQPDDRDGAISTVREVFDEYGFTWDEEEYHADLYDVPGAYLDAGHLFFVAKADDEVIGTVALELFPVIPGEQSGLCEVLGKKRVAGTDCSLERLYVRPGARRGGIGGALMAKVIQEAKERGCRAMEIWSDKRFEGAHRLYQRFGAVVVGERVLDDPDESPEWGLYLDLTE